MHAGDGLYGSQRISVAKEVRLEQAEHVRRALRG